MSKVRFVAQEFDLVEVPHLKDSGSPSADLGEADVAVGRIAVRENLAPAVKASTIVHESLHVMDYHAGLRTRGDILGDRKAEEQFVCRLEPHLHNWIVRNPGLILWMWQVAGVGPEEQNREYQEFMASWTGGEDR